MTAAEIIAALDAADYSAARRHLSAGMHEREFGRVPTPRGDFRFEFRGGWMMDDFAIGDTVFCPLDFGPGHAGSDRALIAEAIGRAMIRCSIAPGLLDLEEEAARHFIRGSAP